MSMSLILLVITSLHNYLSSLDRNKLINDLKLFNALIRGYRFTITTCGDVIYHDSNGIHHTHYKVERICETCDKKDECFRLCK